MKTNFLKSTLVAASFLCIAGSAVAETVHANIPFDFYANGYAMPAGNYTVRPLPGSATVLLFVNEATGKQALAFARTAQDVVAKGAPALTIRTEQKLYELTITSSRGARKNAAIALSLVK